MEAIKTGSCIKSSTKSKADSQENLQPLDQCNYDILPPHEFQEVEYQHHYDHRRISKDQKTQVLPRPSPVVCGSVIPLPQTSPLVHCEPTIPLYMELLSASEPPLQYDYIPAHLIQEDLTHSKKDSVLDNVPRDAVLSPIGVQQENEPEEIYCICDEDNLSSETYYEHKPSPPVTKPPPLSCTKHGTIPVDAKQHNLSIAQKSASIPRNLSSLFEMSLDDLSEVELSQSKIQLWMLLQMQKMVQKMEDAYETAPAPPRNCGMPFLPLPPPQEVQEEKDHNNTSQPTKRGSHYMNMDELEKALAGDPPPPPPPRSYSYKKLEVKEIPMLETRREDKYYYVSSHTQQSQSNCPNTNCIM